MATTRRRVITRGQRRPTSWGGSLAVGLTPVAALTKILLATAVPDFTAGETIRRLRGTFVVTAGSAFFFHGAIGAFIANDTAVSVGVGSLLDPVTDVQDDAWLWYHSFQGGTLAGGAGSAGVGGAQVYEIDSKAMRKMDNGFSMVFVVANSSAVSAFSIAMSVRALGSEGS